MATKISKGDYVLDIYPCAKLHYDPIRGFCHRICKVVYQMFTQLVSGGSSNSLLQSRGADFDDQYVERRRFAQGCAFWASRKQIFTF